jgi:type IV pilus assembly protein PilB
VLLVACPDPLDTTTLRELQVLTRHPVEGVYAPAADIQVAIRQRYSVLPDVDQHVQAFIERVRSSPDAGAAALATFNETSPVVKITDLIIRQGLRDRASDIHIEPQESMLRVRFRIDGLLSDVIQLPKAMGPSLASRIKVMANMDIVDRHRSQDGQLRIENEGRQVDIRVSTAETIWGEKAVLRLLDQSRTLLSLDQLGLAEQGEQRLGRLLKSPYGMIVVSGPTGSGKTTTLYAAINELDPIRQNIMTIEDPVEYTFANINQIQIRRVANLTFANGLKAILRQDPDVILVGEIRDLETAEIAVVQRFIEMGIEGFLISSALVGVVAQRLVRRNCPHCSERYKPSAAEMALWEEYGGANKTAFYAGAGCAQCAGTGFLGRVGVFEVLELSEAIKRMVSTRASAQEIREQGLKEGMVSLRADAVQKVAGDVTTLAEVMRCVWLN